MTVLLAQFAVWVSAGMFLCMPAIYIFAKGRFWTAFFASWFLLYCVASFRLDLAWLSFDGGYGQVAPTNEIEYENFPPDYTNLGIVAFAGWIVALPYCLILNGARWFFRRSEPAQ